MTVPEYDAAGRLRALVEEQSGTSPRRVALPASPERERRALLDALARLERLLLERVEALVRCSEDSFCVALVYEPDLPLPVVPVLGPSEHAERNEANGAAVWSPFGWPDFPRLARHGQEFLAADREISDLTSIVTAALDALDAAERADEVVRSLNRVAARLTRELADMPARPLPRYMAYATDVTGADLAANFERVVALEAPELLADERFRI